MDLNRLIDDLSRPEAYPYAVSRVEVAQTHISMVFLAGPFVYKLKKPVALGFLDFSTLKMRRHFCDEEVRLNRRLAPTVYLSVVAVTCAADGRLNLEGEGEPVEWAVKMRHLPEDATLENWFVRQEVTDEWLRKLAIRLADFHRDAASGEHIREFGRFEVVAGNARENFVQSEELVGVTVRRVVFERVRALTEQQLTRFGSLIEERAQRGMTRDTHGDLHLDHVYFFPDRPAPNDVVILDCIEFNERFRFADPIADIAFLVMDLQFHGYRDLARTFVDAYLNAATDADGAQLLPFYSAYRAVVRGKVEGFQLREQEVSSEEKNTALVHARAHWLLALGELEEPGRRPCLVLVGGLPGTGKSTLARGLAEYAGFAIVRSDVIRKELAGRTPETPTAEQQKALLYAAAWTEKTYQECLRRAEELLFEGRRVIVDASFRHECHRQLFLEIARRWGVPGLFLHCQASPQVVHERLHGRTNDASDADWQVHAQLAAAWEPSETKTQLQTAALSADGSPEVVLHRAWQIMVREGLANSAVQS